MSSLQAHLASYRSFRQDTDFIQRGFVRQLGFSGLLAGDHRTYVSLGDGQYLDMLDETRDMGFDSFFGGELVVGYMIFIYCIYIYKQYVYTRCIVL